MGRILEITFSWDVFAVGLSVLLFAGGLMVADEFKKFTAARVLFIWSALWIVGKVLMWSYLTNNNFYIRGLVTFVIVGLVGVGTSEGMRLIRSREIKTFNDKQELSAQKPPDVQQNNSGGSNINIPGNNNMVTIITAPPAKNPPKKDGKTSDIAEGAFLGEGFKESVTDADLVGVRIGGFYAANPRGWLKQGQLLKPITIGQPPVIPITVGMDQHGKILLTCTISAGSESTHFSVEIKNNVFSVASGFVQKNYNDTALEIATDDGTPLFQMIQESKNLLRINGVFPLYRDKEGKVIRLWAWDAHSDTDPEKPKDFVLKPIFKYPSWKFLGKYAD
jgi:hypothetical protein